MDLGNRGKELIGEADDLIGKLKSSMQSSRGSINSVKEEFSINTDRLEEDIDVVKQAFESHQEIANHVDDEVTVTISYTADSGERRVRTLDLTKEEVTSLMNDLGANPSIANIQVEGFDERGASVFCSEALEPSEQAMNNDAIQSLYQKLRASTRNLVWENPQPNLTPVKLELRKENESHEAPVRHETNPNPDGAESNPGREDHRCSCHSCGVSARTQVEDEKALKIEWPLEIFPDEEFEAAFSKFDFDEEDDFDDFDDEGEEEYQEHLSQLSNELIEYLEPCMKHLASETLIPDDTYFYHQIPGEGLYEKFKVCENGTAVHLYSLKDGTLSSDAIAKTYLADETEYYASDEEILVFSGDGSRIERVAIVEDVRDADRRLEGYLVVTDEGYLKIAARGAEDYFQFIFDDAGAMNAWVVEELGDAARQFHKDAVHQTGQILAEALPYMSPYDLSEISAAGPAMQEFFRARFHLAFEEAIKDPRTEEHKAVIGDMSLKNIDDIEAADIPTGDGKRYTLRNAERFNKYIAYVDPRAERTKEGGLDILFGEVIEETRYDDYEIKILTRDYQPCQTVILDSQVVKELTDYLQMSDHLDFVQDLVLYLERNSASITSGIRSPLILVPDFTAQEIVLARKEDGDVQLKRFRLSDITGIAGVKYGMAAHLDLDILGGYISDK